MPAALAPGSAHEALVGSVTGDPPSEIVFSPRGDRAAYTVTVKRDGGCCTPSVDVGKYVVTVSPAGSHRGETYRWIGPPLFSPTGDRLIYLAAAQGEERLIVTEPGKLVRFAHAEFLTFSPRGHVVFSGREHGDEQESLVVDDRWGKAYDQVANPSFSGDGTQVAYIARDGPAARIVVGNRAGAAYDSVGVARFHGEGGQVSYFAQKGKQKLLVLGDRVHLLPPDAEYAEVSPGFKHVLHEIGGKGRRTLFLDGRPVASWEDVVAGPMVPVFAPDGARFAYVEWKQGSATVVTMDGRGREVARGQPYREIQDLAFAASDAPVYRACREEGCRVVRGEREGPVFSGIQAPVISPDGSTLAYVAHDGASARVVVGDQVFGPYELATPPQFARNGSQVAWGAKRGNDLLWVVLRR